MNWRKVLIDFDVEASVEDYEFRGDDGDYTPDEKDCVLMTDFAHGLIGELIEAIDKVAPQWRPLNSASLPTCRALVTNNLDARDAYGEMSHLWLVRMVHLQDDGTFSAYTDEMTHISNLTHWRPALP